MQLSRDAVIAIFLLGLCGVMYSATLDLPPPMFGQLSSALWPRMILSALALMSFILLIQSQLAEKTERRRRGVLEWLVYYRSPIVCFALFFVFLITLPVLGMLIGGLLYVFLTLSVLGGWKPRQLVLHSLIALFFVVGMWAVFTQLLGVFLPEGTILKVY